MATTFQHRRGSTSSHSTFTGAIGEITVNTTKNTAVVHNGSTSGGFELLRADMNNFSGTISESYMPSGFVKHIAVRSASTLTDRSLTSSYVEHINLSSFVIPSGYTGLVALSIFFSTYNEDGNGSFKAYVKLDGTTDYDSSEFTSARGQASNQGISWGFTYYFDGVAAGTYTPRAYAKINLGSNIILNNKGGEDIFTANVFAEKT